MHANPENYLDMFKPSDSVLSQCTQILIGDPKTPMWAMKRWCHDLNLSLIWAELADVSDHSYVHDEMAAFYFIVESDATLFGLKYR